ncbi:MAG: diacylglycerol kinase family lipid kinase [Chloroflexi bacterium]|nr:MAG: diacylglycerol kinase family lipid kinase [Chloroflexota bacterium]
MKIFLILNPMAGFTGFHKQVQRAAGYLSQHGCQVSWNETGGPGDAVHLARQAADQGYDIAVAIGGDGTINEVVNGIAGTRTALGVLPAGTANVYAADVGIPIWWPLNPEAVIDAADILLTGQRRRVDLGRCRLESGRERYFLMWSGIGLDAAITQARKPAQPRSLSYLSWIAAGLMVAFDFMGTPATITTDEGRVSKRLLLAVASNGQLYGRIWRMAPEAKMDDGCLDVALMSGYGWPSTIKHLVGLTFRRHVKDPDFSLYRTTRLTVSAKTPLPVHVDAETIGTTPVEIDIVPQALTIVVPRHTPPRLFSRPPEG